MGRANSSHMELSTLNLFQLPLSYQCTPRTAQPRFSPLHADTDCTSHLETLNIEISFFAT